MKQLTALLLLCSICLLNVQCTISAKDAKLLKAQRTLLKDMATDKAIEPETKIDALGNSLVTMMNRSIEFTDTKKGAAFIEKFSEQNSKNIDLLFYEISKWQKDLNTFEKIALGASMLQKPYLKELINLIPQVESKYEKYEYVMALTEKLKTGLKSAGAKALGF